MKNQVLPTIKVFVFVAIFCLATNARAMYDPATYNPNNPTFVNNNFSQMQKDAQRVAGAAMMEALVKAAQDGKSSYTIAPETYRVKVNTYRLNNISNFTINCKNVNIWLDIDPGHVVTPGNDALNWLITDGCSNIKFAGGNTNFDSETLQFIQATITGWNPTAGTLDIKIMPGYEIKNFPAKTEGNYSWTFNRKGICETRLSYSSFENVDSGDASKKRLSLGTDFFTQDSGKMLKVGDLFFTRHNLAPWSGVVSSFRTSSNFEFDGINSWYGPMWAIDCTTGSFICRNCSNYRRPGTNRLGGSAEPFIYANMHVLVWDSCTTGGPGQDDGIDVVGGYFLVGESTGSRTVTLAAEHQAGDTLAFYDTATFAPEGEAKVVSVVPFSDTQRAAELVNGLNQNQESRGARWRYGADQRFWTVTLDRDLKIAPFSGYDSDRTSPDVTITNSYFADMNAQALFVKGHHIEVVGNRIDRSNATAIHAQISRYWSEGSVPQNVNISNNVINSNPYGYGSKYGMWDWAVSSIGVEIEGPMPGVGAIRNVRIENNIINNSARIPIMVKNVDGAIIKNNVIIAAMPKSPVAFPSPAGPRLDILYDIVPNGAIFIAASRNVELSGNLLKSPTVHCPNLIQFGPYNERNTFRGDNLPALK